MCWPFIVTQGVHKNDHLMYPLCGNLVFGSVGAPANNTNIKTAYPV
jgi:hypothetical protein